MLLPWLILIPFIGGFLCWQTERFGVKMPRWIALITMGLTLALGLQLWLQGGYSLTQSAGIPQWQDEFILPLNWPLRRINVADVGETVLADTVGTSSSS
jgi:NADH-quinone oxidoreductase subunit M